MGFDPLPAPILRGPTTVPGGISRLRRLFHGQGLVTQGTCSGKGTVQLYGIPPGGPSSSLGADGVVALLTTQRPQLSTDVRVYPRLIVLDVTLLGTAESFRMGISHPKRHLMTHMRSLKSLGRQSRRWSVGTPSIIYRAW